MWLHYHQFLKPCTEEIIIFKKIKTQIPDISIVFDQLDVDEEKTPKKSFVTVVLLFSNWKKLFSSVSKPTDNKKRKQKMSGLGKVNYELHLLYLHFCSW